MKPFDPKWLSEKYQFLATDIARKGIQTSLSENLFEYRNKMNFKKMGVTHPDLRNLTIEETIARSENKDSHVNTATSFYSLDKAFKNVGLKRTDTVMLDIGCGTGRALSYGMFLGFKEVIGIDIDTKGLEIAEANCIKMQESGNKTTFTVAFADACKYVIPGSINLIYLSNPFGRKTMEVVVDNILRHAAQSKDDIYVVYFIPEEQEIFTKHAECKTIFESSWKNKRKELVIFRIFGGKK